MRFVIDAVPAADELTETVVLDDAARGWFVPKIAMIDVTGPIVDAQRRGLLVRSENPVATFVESLRRAENDPRVHAVLIRINSPGGTVTASDVMYRELQHFKARSGKPVVILMGDLATSGGYYIACAGDEIIAHPTSVTGSIGVIIQTFNFADGMSRIGIRADAIVSGDKKAAGSPFQPMPPEHRALLQGMVDEFYDNFVTIVLNAREGLSDEDLSWIADGRVVTGRQAHEAGLVDQVGDLYTAFEAAKRHAGLASARLVKYHRSLEHVGSAYAEGPFPAQATQINLLQMNLPTGSPGEQPGFYYLWDPVVFGQIGP